ncbi:GNAT family N-acetyltransferase [Luteimonas sp. R10]|uniref:GNAT family N-acetyltransferase n=1 Tax=Luteimonas sp. R10 TaxID=3108176 RepID=UPI0030939B57|nr:GNAT family N-acetyltransferase [Luteimonas sp. R10]
MEIRIDRGAIGDIAALEARIPEFSCPKRAAVLGERLRSDNGALILVAFADGQPVGYKAGYPLEMRRFYSWIGAVLPPYRRHGIARALLHEQERRLRESGYASVRVKSRNGFPGMLRLLIGEGYRIVALEAVPSPQDPKIVFDKRLAPLSPSEAE